MNDFPTCSRCVKVRELSLVSIPQEMLNHSLFLELYRLGWTNSNPQTAVEIAFGRAERTLQDQAERILQGD